MASNEGNQMIQLPVIQGSKGKKPRTPVEAPNSLKSAAVVRILDLVSEGEIVGFANGMKSLFLDETPLQNEDDSLNFENVQVDWRYGTQSQDYIPGFPGVENELGIGVELTYTTPYERTFNNLNLNAVRVRLSVPALSKSNPENGDVTGWNVSYTIEVSTDGGPYVKVITSAFTGKTMSKYERDHRIDLEPATTGWTIRVRRTTTNGTGAEYNDKTFVESMVEIIDAKLRYPNSAIVGVTMDAAQFPSIPTRAYDLKGRIVRVPSNYNAASKVYTGVWDGTFQLAWTDNPAWIYFDLVTHDRYGLGHILTDSHINKWKLYDIAKYCDELVPTGHAKRGAVSSGSQTMSINGTTRVVTRSAGSFLTDGFLVGDAVTLTGFSTDNNGDALVEAVDATTMTLARPVAYTTQASAAARTIALRDPLEHRFTCNVYLQQQVEAYKAIQDLATVFRGIAYWGGGEIHALSDKPEDPVYTYTPANVIDGQFVYQGSGQKARHSVALVSWNDPNNFGRSVVEYIDDPDAIARYGIHDTDMTAIGCTSQGQAQRMGRYLLATANYETQTVNFSVALDGTLVAPGKVIRVADPLRAGKRMGGRLASVTSASVVVVDGDAPTITTGVDTLTIIKPDGVAETRTISAISTNTITVSPAFSAAPAAGSVWAIDRPGLLETQLFRVISVTENTSDEKFTYTISAVQHNPSKFDAVDFKTKIDVAPISSIVSMVQVPPTLLAVTHFESAGQVITSTVLNIDFVGAAGAVGYDVEYRRDNGQWVNLPRTKSTTVDVPNVWGGVYQVRVRAVNAINVASNWVMSTAHTVPDQTMTPGYADALAVEIADALATAENAQATADGAIVSFWQTSPPVIGAGAGQAKEGDLWFDTDDGNKVYRVTTGSWAVAADDDMAVALAAAQDAQSTADGKVKTFFSSTTPTAEAVGDLWYNTTTKKLLRWNGSTWNDQIADITAENIAGSGINILPDEYSIYGDATLPPVHGTTNVTLSRDAATSYYGEGSLKLAATGTDARTYLFPSASAYNMPHELGRKYIVSCWVRCSQASKPLQFFAYAPSGAITSVVLTTHATANTWKRVSGALNMSANGDPNWALRINNQGGAGVDMWIDGIMVEEQVGLLTVPSAYARGSMDERLVNAIAAAAAAQDTADGKIETFFQTAMPTGTLGDLWFDTDDGNKVYRHNGTTFVVAADTDIAVAIADAAGAQATADGKVTTFYALTAPTPGAVGDLWYNTTTKVLSRWNGSTWVTVSDITADKIAGNGANILWEEYNVFRSSQTLNTTSVPAVFNGGNSSIITATDSFAMGGFSIRATTGTATNNQDYFYLNASNSVHNLNIGGNKKYLLSFYAKCNVGGHQIRVFTRGDVVNDGPAISLTGAFVRYTRVIDASAVEDGVISVGFWTNYSAVAGRLVYFDRIMLEPLIGNDTTPSPFVQGPSALQTGRAIANAALAQATADGKIDSYYQITAPTGASEGDIWFDTDDTNKIYTYRSGAWVATPDSRIAQAITDAAGAQATADGKVKTFYQTTTPTAEGAGDLWFNKNTSELKRWSGSAWVSNFSAPTAAAAGANLLPNPTFQLNTLGNGVAGTPALNTQFVDGWIVSRDNSAWGAEVYTNWPTSTAGILRCRVNKPVAVPNATYVAGQARILSAIPVEANAKYVFSYEGTPSFNGTSAAGVTYLSRMVVRWLDSAGAEVSTPVVASLGRVSTTSAMGEATAPATAKTCHVYLDVIATNNSGAAWTHDSTVAIGFDFKSVSMIRKVNLDDYIDDGTDYGRYAVDDRFLFGGKYRVGLRIGTSGHRIGNQRNLVRSNTSAYGMVRTTTALTATSAGAVSVNAHTVRYGGYSIAYNAVSNAVTGLTVGTSYVIYCTDADLTGGTKTYFAGTNPETVMNISDDIYVVGQITIPSSGSSSGGGGGGGTDPGDWCVDWDTVLPDGRLVRDLRIGDLVPCWNSDVDNPQIEMLPVITIGFGAEESYRLLTDRMAAIKQSKSTPMDLRDGRSVTTVDMLGEDVLVNRSGDLAWETVTSLEPAGIRRVVKVNLGNRVYFAGEVPEVTIATHNAIHKP